MSLADEYVEKEIRRMGWLELLTSRPSICSTEDLASPLKRLQKDETIISPSIFQKFFIIAFILFGAWLGSFLIRVLISGSMPFFIPLAGLFFIGAILSVAIWFSFFAPQYHFRIKLNRDHIEVAGKKISWKEISGMGIMIRGG